MRGVQLAAAVLLALVAGCLHTREVADPSQPGGDGATEAAERERPQGEERRPPDDAGRAEKPERGRDVPEPESEGQADERSGDGQDEGEQVEPEEIPTATSVRGLLRPGAEERVRRELGLSEQAGLRRAVREFQRRHDLPATGTLDQETVKLLGLDPDEIFERAE